MPNNNKPKTILFLPYICTLLDQTKPQHINLINSSKNSIRSVYHLFQCNLSGKYSQKIHISWTDLLFFLITTYNSTNKICFLYKFFFCIQKQVLLLLTQQNVLINMKGTCETIVNLILYTF